jgi:hypothetical protein
MDKYGDIEKAYRENLDAWLCNIYFSIQRKDTLANPYSVQLILDQNTQEMQDKLQQNNEIKITINQSPKNDPDFQYGNTHFDYLK